ncbi:MAG: TetR/AcrR family transcriptional regulator [Pseudomonadota bacterium]|nr:TetR/AcrR family transcriptional regulator [Pseudomonadota bacterium]
MNLENCSAESTGRRVPRGQKRREEIAAIAERIFLERGFTETTMQLVAARAGASKETLYRHFGNKEELFAEIVRRRSARITGGQDGELDMNETPREVLGRLGLSLLDFLTCADSLSFSRVMVAEAVRAPELGRIFYAQGPARVHRELARYLGCATRRGELHCPEPQLAAKLFLGAIVANYQILGLIAPGFEPFKPEKMRVHVEEAVSLFLARYGPSP